MPSANQEIAALLTEWAELLQLSGADGFRIRAYERAARAIAGHDQDVRSLPVAEILRIPSVGKNMAARVREYVETGSVADLEDLRAQVPAGLRGMLRIRGLGPKKALLIHQTLGVGSVEELVAAARDGALRGIKGLGAKTEANLLEAIERYAASAGRTGLGRATDIAGDLIAALRTVTGVERIEAAGSLRRMAETVGDLDLLVAASEGPPVMDAFVALDGVADVLARGDTKTSILTTAGLQVDLRVIPEESWGAALIYFTGSKAHNIKIREMAVKAGWKLSEWGLFEAGSGDIIVARTEEEVYERLGLPWIPPPMREDRGEIEAARAGELPVPVQRSDIRGDLHSHTDRTDGIATMRAMIEAGIDAGYRYLAITDHAEGLSMSGMTRESVLDQRAELDELQRHYPAIELLHGCELNIARDGSVDYDAAFLEGFDVTVASVHSSFRLSQAEQTTRLIRAMENPAVAIIGHPSGRQIGRRDPIDFDTDAVFEAAARTGTALEVNSLPDRLDLRDEHVRWAIARGVTISIDTDSHATVGFDNLRFGVGTAQRGWATKRDVLNARTARQLRAFIGRKRG